MRSFAHRPMTNDHPKEMVTADNWKKVTVGHTGDEVARDGEAIRVPMVLMDAQAIQDWDSGKRQLSMGYTSELVWKDGTTEAGEQYDAIQTNIRANHLALVKLARGGPELRLDQQEENLDMTTPAATTLRSINVDGVNIEMSDTAAQVVLRAIAAMTDRFSKTEKDMLRELDEYKKFKKMKEEVEEDSKKKLEGKDGEIAALKKQIEDAQVTPDKLDRLVVARVALVTSAKKIIGDKLVTAGKTDDDIRRQVVSAKLGDATVKDKSVEYIQACFDTIAAGAKDSDPLSGALHNHNQNPRPVSVQSEDSEKAYEKMIFDMQNAWKGDQHKPAA